MNDTGNAVAATQAQSAAVAMVDQYRSTFSEVLPEHIRAATFLRQAKTALKASGPVLQAAQSNPGDAMRALLDCAQVGATPGKTYHFVPFKGRIVGVEDYANVIERMFRAGGVSSVRAEVVRARDLDPHPDDGHPRFVWEPTEMERPRHRPDLFGDRGELMGAYAYAQMVGGGQSQVIFMNRAEIERVRESSPHGSAGKGPWREWPDRMYKKTVLRALEKYVPTSNEFLRHRARVAQEATEATTAHEATPLEDVVEAEIVDQEGEQ